MIYRKSREQFGEYENMSYFTIRNTTIGAARVETEDSRRYGEAKKSAQNSPRRIQIFRERITYVCLRIIVSQKWIMISSWTFSQPGKAESNDDKRLLGLSPYSATAYKNNPLFSRGHNSHLPVIIARKFTRHPTIASEDTVESGIWQVLECRAMSICIRLTVFKNRQTSCSNI